MKGTLTYDKIIEALNAEYENTEKSPIVAWFSRDVGKLLGFSDEELDKMVFEGLNYEWTRSDKDSE